GQQTGRRLVAALVELFGIRGPAAQVLDAPPMARVRRHELRRGLAAARRLVHPLPELDRLDGVVAGSGHQQQTDVVGFRLVRAAERQQDADICPGAKQAEDLGALLGTDVAQRRRRGNLRDFDHLLLRHALGAVASEGVANLVPHHRRQPGVGFAHRQDGGVDDHLAAWQAERIDLVAADYPELPVELHVRKMDFLPQGRVLRGLRQTQADAAYRLDDGALADDVAALLL